MTLERKPTAVLGISGSIGAGKSTLVDAAVSAPYRWMFIDLLKEYPHIPKVVEKYQERFDSDLLGLVQKSPQEFAPAFQTNIITASVTLEGLIAEKGGLAFLDRTIYEHRHVFAELQYQRGMLIGKAFNAYDALFQTFTEYVPPPLAYIWMKASTETLKERIKIRGREQEQWLLGDDPYLQQLNDAYQHFFSEVVKEPVIIVDTEDINLFNGDPKSDQLDHAFFQKALPYITTKIRDLKILDKVKVD